MHKIKQQDKKKENLIIKMVKESDDPKWESRQDHDKTFIEIFVLQLELETIRSRKFID